MLSTSHCSTHHDRINPTMSPDLLRNIAQSFPRLDWLVPAPSHNDAPRPFTTLVECRFLLSHVSRMSSLDDLLIDSSASCYKCATTSYQEQHQAESRCLCTSRSTNWQWHHSQQLYQPTCGRRCRQAQVHGGSSARFPAYR